MAALDGVCFPDAPGSASVPALDAARAEFRAAWQAKQERAGRLRAYARKAKRHQTGWLKLGMLLLLVSGGVLAVGLLNGAPLGELMRTPLYRLLARGYLLCSLVYAVAWIARRLWNRAAAWLEAAEVRYPDPRLGPGSR